ncbi:MAG: hypothetical protein WC692_07375 [Erythrobacter sp.]|jgi:hypothetical protein
MKTLSPAALAALEAGEAIVSGALEIACTPVVRVWGGYHQITFDGRSFDPIGDRALAQVMGGALGDAAQDITLALSGIDAETLALLDATGLSGAPAVLWRLIFDQSGNTLLDFDVWARGRLDTLESDEEIGGTAAITARLETAAKGLGRSGARMRSDADQRLIDPADGFFKNVSYAGEKTLYWGGRRPSRAGSALPGAGGGFGGGGIAADLRNLVSR